MDPYLLFQLRGDSTTNETNTEQNNSDGDQNKNNILCVLWKSNKLGAAYYSITDNLLYVYEEYIDNGPQFPILKCLYREVLPNHTICIGTRTDTFIQTLIDIINKDDSVSIISADIKSLPPNFTVLQLKEYPYEICKSILLNVEIASFIENESPGILKEMYVHTLINFDSKISIYAAGALLKYLDKNWTIFSPDKELKVIYIHQVTLKNRVLIDWSSINAFQIFQQKSHEAGFKRGVYSNNKEGLSMFKIYSSYCKSRIGQTCLKNILLNPIYDIIELNRRLNFIQFILNLSNREFTESLQDNIKNLVDVNTILQDIHNSKAKSSSWHTLKKTIYHTIIINELSGPHRHKSILLSELNDKISEDLIKLHQSIDEAFDFSKKFKCNRPVINFGVDAELDAKKLRRKDIARYLTAAARVAVEGLPDYLTECAVVYLPEMGHLVAIKEWSDDCNPQELNSMGYEFKFTVGGIIHYKSPLCLELDTELGDINAEIIAHENRIIHRLSRFVLKHNNDIRAPLKIVALMDSLIALAKVSEARNFVKPNLNDQRIHSIEKGRHPLIEEMFQNFVPNDFYSGGNNSRMKIITGPNGSGKSIYLKQIGIIIYLAHIGSYVPAKKANIAMVHSIHFRIATESASVHLSAFMIDITQITQAMHNAKPSSLIIMDEFGKGTSGEDGVILMAGVLRNFLKNNDNCPHILVSTHYQQILPYLPKTSLIEYQKMNHTKSDEEGFVLLFELTKGVSASYAFDVAEAVGLDSKLIDRAKEIFNCLKNNEPIKPKRMVKKILPVQPKNKEELLNYLSNIELPEGIQDNPVIEDEESDG